MRENPDTLIDMAYDALEGTEDLMKYHQRHGTVSVLILTQHSPEVAQQMARLLQDEIKDKVVIEIGAGVGFLAIELAKIARQVFAIEVDPAWSWIFTRSLYSHKPANLTWIFGTAQSVLPFLKGDIALVVTRSGVDELYNLAQQFAPKVIMPFQEETNEAASD